MRPDVMRYRVDGSVAFLELADSARGNAMSLAMARALRDCTAQAVRDGVRIVVLDAPEGPFCVGGDLREIGGADEPGAVVAQIAEDLHEGVATLLTMDAIVITVVRGTAAGAGFPLAMVGDIVLAADSASFTMAYTKAGLTPDGGSSLLVATLGRHKAMELMLLNSKVTAAELRTLGLIHGVHPLDDLDAARDRLVAELLQGSAGAQLGTKRLVRAVLGDVREHLDREARSVESAAQSADGVEGVRAFLQKRRPGFQ